MMSSAAVMPILYIGSLLVRAVERARRLPIVAQNGPAGPVSRSPFIGVDRK